MVDLVKIIQKGALIMKRILLVITVAAMFIAILFHYWSRSQPILGNDIDSIDESIMSLDFYKGKQIDILEVRDIDELRVVALLCNDNPSITEFEIDESGNYKWKRSEKSDKSMNSFLVYTYEKRPEVTLVCVKNNYEKNSGYSFKVNGEIYNVRFDKKDQLVEWVNLKYSEGGVYDFEWDSIEN